MDEKTRARLGDRAAQEAITARGETVPCPWCGYEFGIAAYRFGMCRYECSRCGGAGPIDVDRKHALAKWNIRVPLLTPAQMALLQIGAEPRKLKEDSHGTLESLRNLRGKDRSR